MFEKMLTRDKALQEAAEKWADAPLEVLECVIKPMLGEQHFSSCSMVPFKKLWFVGRFINKLLYIQDNELMLADLVEQTITDVCLCFRPEYPDNLDEKFSRIKRFVRLLCHITPEESATLETLRPLCECGTHFESYLYLTESRDRFTSVHWQYTFSHARIREAYNRKDGIVCGSILLKDVHENSAFSYMYHEAIRPDGYTYFYWVSRQLSGEVLKCEHYDKKWEITSHEEYPIQAETRLEVSTYGSIKYESNSTLWALI